MSEFKSTKVFLDNKNYPRGFARHGDYTIKEAKLLEESGNYCLELETGQRVAKTKAEKDFLKALKDPSKATTDLQKAWLKYKRLTSVSKVVHTLSSNSITGELDDPTVES